MTKVICTGWIAVQRDVKINYDLENSPLQIRTDSEVGSNETVMLWFLNAQGYNAGGVNLHFSSPPQYLLYTCSTSWTKFPADLPSETDKVWKITLTRTSGVPRVVIHCNNSEVVNVTMSGSTCYSSSDWSTLWSRNVDRIMFIWWDTASDYYRQAPVCTGLKTEWTSTIETTTQFPVAPGTVVEVTCSNSDAVNEGSSEVTCTTGTDFTFSKEPKCTKQVHTCTTLTVNHATVSPSGAVNEGEVVTVTCSEPERYVLIGNKQVTCQFTGWSEKPECRKCDNRYRGWWCSGIYPDFLYRRSGVRFPDPPILEESAKGIRLSVDSAE
ncbi:hypothetical protein ACHWQZ_G019369 [Mnemiopsis leidyi]